MSGISGTEIVEALVALLLVASGVLVLIGAFGVLRLGNFFERLHAVALIPTLATWCVALASMVYFSWHEQTPVLYQIAIVLFLAITVPVPTVLLMRTALFRKRGAGQPAPSAFDRGGEGAASNPR